MRIKRLIASVIPAVVGATCTFGQAGYIEVEARDNATKEEWRTYRAVTIDHLPGFRERREPAASQYGGWMAWQSEATGFFRTEKVDGRWWIIDPDGYPFIHKGVAVFSQGGSDRQQEEFRRRFGTPEAWARDQMGMLRGYGFNGLGAWSDVNTVREMDEPMVYTVIISPMGEYRSQHERRYGGSYHSAGWQGYRFNLAMVFDPEFDEYIERALAPIARYRDDKYLLGYFTDNELPWVNDALDRHLTLLAHDETAYLTVKEWFDGRKGHEAGPEEITDEDRRAFLGFYFEAYVSKVEAALRKYDPNHLYLGCRFNQHHEEMSSPEIFRVAGKYMDIISINHYRKWQPEEDDMRNWEEWSGKPFMITEWYTKGEDSGLPNNTGAGWNVRTQADRAAFYQNFTLELLRSGNCVGWHWFTYMDNDPENLRTDPSNRDSNKGVVTWDFQPYLPLLEGMKRLNDNVWNLVNYFDNSKSKH
ncbi:MAG: hypothetical protein LIO85_02825 [Rikenellaceae bacterium]|nr:hypothetical protein [Rikenellaceae bacterium]